MPSLLRRSGQRGVGMLLNGRPLRPQQAGISLPPDDTSPCFATDPASSAVHIYSTVVAWTTVESAKATNRLSRQAPASSRRNTAAKRPYAA